MSRFELEFEVYDDGDRSTNDSSIIGVAAVSLKELIEGLPVEGYVPLYSAQVLPGWAPLLAYTRGCTDLFE